MVIERKTGLLPIYNCDNLDLNGDVIFIHGLEGHPIKTWHPNENELKKVDSEKFWINELPNLNFWLNWLGKYRQDLGIWSYGYEAKRFNKNKDSSIFAQASELKDLLATNKYSERPRIFIAHSLGGIIVKKMLFQAYNSSNEDTKNAVCGQTKGIVFLATPHGGSHIANSDLQNSLIKIAKICVRPNNIVDELSSNNVNTQLFELKNWYSDHASLLNIKTKAFIETKKMNIRGMGDQIVVDFHSGDPGVSGVEPTFANKKNHKTISKPESKGDTMYIVIEDFIDKSILKKN